VAGLGGGGGGGGSGGNDEGAEGSRGSAVAGSGGGGGGGGRVDGSASDSDMEEEAPALDEDGNGILGPARQPKNKSEKASDELIHNCRSYFK
jgi:hypothetical protein